MKRLIIAVDCDDVLIPSQEFIVNTYNRLYDANVELGQDFEEWGSEYDEVMNRCGQIAQSAEFKNLAPDPKGVVALADLAQQHELHLVTARKREEREFTKAAIERSLPGVFMAMEFVGWKGSKGDVCVRIGADVLIDDNVSHLYDAIQKGLPSEGAILFGDYPWQGESATRGDVRRCLDWGEVRKEIDRLAAGE